MAAVANASKNVTITHEHGEFPDSKFIKQVRLIQGFLMNFIHEKFWRITSVESAELASEYMS